MPILSTGLARLSEERRQALCAQRPFHVSSLELTDVLQPIWTIRAQLGHPSCVGQTAAAGIESLDPATWAEEKAAGRTMADHLCGLTVGPDPRVGGVGIWWDALWRQGDLGNPYVGTLFETAIDSVILRGWPPYVPGEDAQPPTAYVDKPDIRAEMGASDHQVDKHAEHHAIEWNRVAGVVDALRRGLVVGMGGGRRARFGELRIDEVATAVHIGGDRNGHEERIVGYIASLGLFIVQGSWGVGTFGCTLPADMTLPDGSVLRRGTFLPGCYKMQADCLDVLWAVDCLEIKYA